ncbi:MAG: MarR family transcriptional regulator [Coriobacteriales bacterium]|jgi:DNA-binding MarR family transcriptional regulator|nr:MarR family transcriptional regulator [Coriobacteriales bacterium]
MYKFMDDAFPADIDGDQFAPDSAQMELIMECHRAARLLQRLYHFKGRNLHSQGVPLPPDLPQPGDLPVPPDIPIPPGNPFLNPARRQAFGSMRGQGRLLHLLSKSDGVLIKDIVMAFDIRPSSASELVAKLEKQGLIRVESDTDDKRARKVFLTDEGKDLNDRIKSSADEFIGSLFDGLSDEEQTQLLSLMKKMNSGLAEKSEMFGKPGGKDFDTRHGDRGHGEKGHGDKGHDRRSHSHFGEDRQHVGRGFGYPGERHERSGERGERGYPGEHEQS